MLGQDYAVSAQMILKAAKLGNEGAQLLIGTMYYKGLGVKQDYQESKKWLPKIAYGDYVNAAQARKIIDTIEKNTTVNQLSNY